MSLTNCDKCHGQCAYQAVNCRHGEQRVIEKIKNKTLKGCTFDSWLDVQSVQSTCCIKGASVYKKKFTGEPFNQKSVGLNSILDLFLLPSNRRVILIC